MHDNLHIIPYEQVKQVRWRGDSIRYDWALHALDQGKHDYFLVTSVDPENENLFHYIEDFDVGDETTCVVWNHKKKWIAKLFPKNWIIGSYKSIDIELSKLKWERNSDIPESIEFENDPTLSFVHQPWDVKFELVWYVDNSEVWDFKCYQEGKVSKGVKNMGYVVPVIPKLKWERNSDIPESIEFENDPTDKFNFGLWNTDYEYELVWYVDNSEVWAFKCHPENKTSKGFKNMGDVIPKLPQCLDVIFISYKESNAEENWQRVLEKAPWAKRVDGVEGIFNAHQAAAKLSTTDMFYAVDGDAWLVDDFDFDFQPGLFDRDCTHIWRAKNPVNGLIYGYGGVKLFSKQVIEDAIGWTTLDLSTTITSNIKIVNEVSNVTVFNTDEVSTWRSAFRECVKLCYSIHRDPDNKENQQRLKGWMEPSNQPFAQHAIDAAHEAKEWVKQNVNDIDTLRLVNDRDWITKMFFQYEYKKNR